jgi:opacity protein-like surface antigen
LKKILIISAATAAMFGASIAQADMTAGLLDNWEDRSYAQAKLGFVDLGTSDDGMALTATAGLEAPSIHESLSFEVDVMKTLTDGESTYPSAFGSTKVEASAFGVGAYAVSTYKELPIEGLEPYFRLGLAYTSVDVSASNNLVSASGEASEFGIAYGAGLKYDLGAHVDALENVGVLVDFTSTEVDSMSLGVDYRF